jgi:hypothetical protein
MDLKREQEQRAARNLVVIVRLKIRRVLAIGIVGVKHRLPESFRSRAGLPVFERSVLRRLAKTWKTYRMATLCSPQIFTSVSALGTALKQSNEYVQ